MCHLAAPSTTVGRCGGSTSSRSRSVSSPARSACPRARAAHGRACRARARGSRTAGSQRRVHRGLGGCAAARLGHLSRPSMIVAALALARERGVRAARRARAAGRGGRGHDRRARDARRGHGRDGRRLLSFDLLLRVSSSSYGAAAMSTATVDALAGFSTHARALVRGARFGAPTPAQTLGWPPIAARRARAVCAPTGSGKTLAAFLWCLDRLMLARAAASGAAACSTCRRSRRSTTTSSATCARRSRASRATAAARGGDLPPAERRGAHGRHAARGARGACCARRRDILITTPESLYLMLTSHARDCCAGVETVIVDEIHAVAATKRGAHLALSLERLGRSARRDPQRIGAVGHAAAARGDRALPRRRPRDVRRSSTPACASSSTCAIEVPVEDMARRPSRWPTCRGRRRRAAGALDLARASTRGCSSSCARTARRSSS